jgi:hypothetical protein
MSHRRRRLAARFLAVGLLAATLSAVNSLTFPDTAEARCNGVNNPVTSTYSYGGYLRASETPLTGTCNANGTYRGTLKDRRADGNCVHVQFREPSEALWRIPDGGTACGGTSTFEWRDLNGDAHAYQRFCIVNANTGFVACGWGSDQGGYGLNHGY